MRLSQSFVKTSKSVSEELESTNARLLTQGGYIKQEIAGVYSFLPLGVRVLANIENIVRQEMNLVGMEVLLPSLSSRTSWEKTGRDESVDVLFKASGANKISAEKNSAEYILNSTHEEVITPLMQSFAQSYKDLPTVAYQIQTKFRNEARAKSGLLRGREFRMKDLYSFHVSEADLLSFYETMKVHYLAVYARLGLGEETFVTYASGGDFTQAYSHEFQTLLENGEDTIYLDRENHIAYNREIVTEEDSKKLGVDFSKLEQVRASEVGNIFPLNTKFSKAFDYSYLDEQGEKQLVYMGCYGIGTSRLMGVIAEKLADAKGLVWPQEVAPFTYHLVTLHGENTHAESEKVYAALGAEHVLWDDRTGKGAGEMFADADLLGMPVQLIISPRNLANGVVEVKSRSSIFAAFTLPLEDIAKLPAKLASL
jgi:prolyl-tRNA synthetase